MQPANTNLSMGRYPMGALLGEVVVNRTVENSTG
jgi:hypothetical protein